jgi:hypothetical protein
MGIIRLMEVCELAANKLCYFCPSSLQGISRGRSMYHIVQTHSSLITLYATITYPPRQAMKNNPLVQRNKYQNGFYCDAI